MTDRLGVQFIHQTGVTGNYLVPEQMGSGAALFDFDNDGRLDLYLIQNAGRESSSRNQLFHQEAAGRFRNVSEGSGLDVAGPGMGAAAGDVNNDGWTDLVLTEYGAVRLFLNQAGTGRFREVTGAAGIDNPRWATSAAFLDYDRDGWLDLVIANYLDYDPSQKCSDAKGAPEFCGPHGFPGLSVRLFHNLGGHISATHNPDSPAARFEDVTIPSKLAAFPGPALGVVCADFDGDRWPDIFLADDGKPNRLFVNQRDGTFTEEASQRGLALNALGQTAGNMGIAIGDLDGDGLFDLFVTHLSEEQHALWAQQPRGLFMDRTGTAGLANPSWRGTGFGAVLADFDQDGALDLAFVNGLVKRHAGPGLPPVAAGTQSFWAPYAQRAQLFANRGQGSFYDVSEANPAFCREARVGRGLAVGDLDNDGALDLVMTSVGGPVRIFRNVAPSAGHWLTVRAIDPAHGGRDAYGAELIIQGAPGTQRRWWGLVQPGSSYLCSNDPRVHFGLGPNPGPISIQVRWPEGELELFTDIHVDSHVLLRKGSGRKETQ
ncbi:MAG TPA: CRTAC1 family protein [Verrucomicrobiae bacterium]|nr:CRTAC1 family protein [Verrucomicrobiae bacterium]